MNKFSYGILYGGAAIPSQNELTARLGEGADLNSEPILRTVCRIAENMEIKYAAARVNILRGSDWVDLGFGRIESKALIKNLSNAREAFVFAVTLGVGVDRLIAREGARSAHSAFIFDSVASAMAEAACNAAEKVLRIEDEQIAIGSDVQVCPRFSPGYADFSLSHQPALLDFLDAGRKIGLYIGESLLMTPKKSITAVMGIKNL